MKLDILIALHKLDTHFVDCLASVAAESDYFDRLLLIINSGLQSQEVEAFLKENEIFIEKLEIFETPVTGLSFSLSLGVHISNADLIARIDSDDILIPGRLNTQRYRFETNHKLVVCGTKFISVNHKGDEINEMGYYFKNQQFAKTSLAFACTIAHPTVMFRRLSVTKAGNYGMYGFAEDYDLWLRMLRDPDAQVEILSITGVKYRRHDNQITQTTSILKKILFHKFLLVREFLETRNILYLIGFVLGKNISLFALKFIDRYAKYS